MVSESLTITLRISLKLKLSGLYSNLFVIIFSLIFHKTFGGGGRKQKRAVSCTVYQSIVSCRHQSGFGDVAPGAAGGCGGRSARAVPLREAAVRHWQLSAGHPVPGAVRGPGALQRQVQHECNLGHHGVSHPQPDVGARP